MPVWTWGSDVYGRLGQGTEDIHRGRPSEVKAMDGVQLLTATCGSAHNIAVDTAGRCYTWGKCHYGQLGHGEMDRNELVPKIIDALQGVRIKAVGAGDSHVLAVADSGELYTWGVGFYGCLGHGDESSLTTPKLVEKLRGEKITAVTGGAFHSMATTEDGRLFVWGRDHRGQLGMKPVEIPNYSAGGKGTKLVHLNQKVLVELKLPSPCKMVSACNDHSLVLLENGTVLSFGANDQGQLGRTEKDNEVEEFQIDSSHFKNSRGEIESVEWITAGWNHCAAITSSGLLYTWGEGGLGQLGLGHTRGSPTPSLVEQFPHGESPRFTQVSCGDSFTVAVTGDIHIWAFGSPDYGKLGVDSSHCATTPRKLQHTMSGHCGFCCGTNHTILYALDSQST